MTGPVGVLLMWAGLCSAFAGGLAVLFGPVMDEPAVTGAGLVVLGLGLVMLVALGGMV